MGRVAWDVAPDVQARMVEMVHALGMAHVDPARIVCMRSRGSKARFLARIWPLPTVWQVALGVHAHYVIEVKAESFDRLARPEQDRTIIHELLHIPRTFSGAVLPHRHPGGNVDEYAVTKYYRRWRIRQDESLQEPGPGPVL